MGEGMTWEKVVDDMLNRAANLRLQGQADKARTLEEGARAIFNANKFQIMEKINTAKAALMSLGQRATAITRILETRHLPVPSNPVNITGLQNRSIRLSIKLDPFLIMQVREWIMDYAAYRHGAEFYEEYKSEKQFIDQQWLLYYLNGRSQYPINKDGYRQSRNDSFT